MLVFLRKDLGVPVVCTAANKGRGVSELMQKALETAQMSAAKVVPYEIKLYDESIEKNILQIKEIINQPLGIKVHNPKWVALKLLEGDEKVKEKLNVALSLLESIKPYQEKLEKEYDNDMESIIADGRYRFISGIVSKAVKKNSKGSELTVSDKIDKLVTHRLLAIPLFLALMFAVFQITFGAIGSFTIDWVDKFINVTLAGLVSTGLQAANAAQWLQELIVNGIIAGLGSILVFVPQIMIMFFFLSILEDSGYMARAAFVMDRLLRKLGLSGKSFIPMLMGFGCSVPAIMASRTLENEKDRRLTIILTPFMSCGARLPVYALFAAAFFAKNQSVIIFYSLCSWNCCSYTFRNSP